MSFTPSAKPIVSVCLPVYNGEKFLQRSIESALSQSFTDFELLIADDASSDESSSMIQRYADQDRRIVFWRNDPRLGLFANYNACIEKASGTYIKLFAQDDLWAPELLEKQVALLDQYPQVALVSCKKKLIDETGAELFYNFTTIADVLGETFLYPAGQIIKACLNQHWDNLVGEPSTVMFRRALRGNGFDTGFRHAGDLDYWLRILRHGDLAMVNEPLVSFRKHKDAATRLNVAQLWAYTDIIRLADTTADALAQMGLSPAQFISANLVSLASAVPRHISGEVDLTGIDEEDRCTAGDVASLKKSFLYALSLIPSDKLNAPVVVPEILQNEQKIAAAEELLRKILGSGSWRATKPLREINRFVFGAPRKSEGFNEALTGDASSLEQQLNYLKYLKSKRYTTLRSRSWKYTRLLRQFARVSVAPKVHSQAMIAQPVVPVENDRACSKYDFVIAVHEASRTGAPLLALSFATRLKERGWSCLIVLQEAGVLLNDFKSNFDVIELCGVANKTLALDLKLKQLSQSGAIKDRTPVFLNSAVVNVLADSFRRYNFHVISLIHEVLSNFSYIERNRLLKNSDIAVFSSSLTLQSAKDSYKHLGESHVIPQGLLDEKFAALSHESGREFLINELGIHGDAFVVLSCGTADQRKGIDLFPLVARQVILNAPSDADIHFVWIGGTHAVTYESFWWAKGDAVKLGIADKVHFVGAQNNIEPYFVGANMFLLCSREDPMPCVLHQAQAAKLPIVAFDGSGGATDLLSEGGGKLVPYGDIIEMASAIVHYVENKEECIADGTIGQNNVLTNYQMDHYVDKLLALASR